jgi:hypothetical protein
VLPLHGVIVVVVVVVKLCVSTALSLRNTHTLQNTNNTHTHTHREREMVIVCIEGDAAGIASAIDAYNQMLLELCLIYTCNVDVLLCKNRNTNCLLPSNYWALIFATPPAVKTKGEIKAVVQDVKYGACLNAGAYLVQTINYVSYVEDGDVWNCMTSCRWEASWCLFINMHCLSLFAEVMTSPEVDTLALWPNSVSLDITLAVLLMQMMQLLGSSSSSSSKAKLQLPAHGCGPMLPTFLTHVFVLFNLQHEEQLLSEKDQHKRHTRTRAKQKVEAELPEEADKKQKLRKRKRRSMEGSNVHMHVCIRVSVGISHTLGCGH